MLEKVLLSPPALGNYSPLMDYQGIPQTMIKCIQNTYIDKKILAHKVILIFAIATQKKMLKNIYAVFIFVINIKDGAKKFLSMAQYHLRTKGHFLHFPLDNQWMDVPGVVERIFLSTEYTQWHNGKKNLVWNREKGHKDEEILCYDLHLHKPQGEKTAPA